MKPTAVDVAKHDTGAVLWASMAFTAVVFRAATRMVTGTMNVTLDAAASATRNVPRLRREGATPCGRGGRSRCPPWLTAGMCQVARCRFSHPL